ncbi:hypothetical protein PAPYR_3356 [Paratrimastix pyriformis]|uniref:Uncharacterized protein n=1 Tax=Paratrimastix pyriformis TaxID=342808 RepID=A0ABQ8UMD7_9EUKA|nr:hypothetical protein PAPYR_3356 [Paratrimastix pyriformis]
MGQIGVQPSKDNSSTASGISFGCFLAGSARVRPCRHFRPPPGRPQVPVPMRQPLEGVDPVGLLLGLGVLVILLIAHLLRTSLFGSPGSPPPSALLVAAVTVVFSPIASFP